MQELWRAASLGVWRVSAQSTQPAAQWLPPAATAAVAVHDYVGAGLRLVAGHQGPGMAQWLGSSADLNGQRGHGHGRTGPEGQGPLSPPQNILSQKALTVERLTWVGQSRNIQVSYVPPLLKTLPLQKNQISHHGQEAL